jgi:hypothetical protein
MNKTEKKIEALKIRAAKMQAKFENDIYAICEQLEYRDSSNFSYNIDRLRQFINGLNEFSLLPPPPTDEQVKASQVL